MPCRRPDYGVRVNAVRTSLESVYAQLEAAGARPAPSPLLPLEFLRLKRLQPLLQSGLLAQGTCQVGATAFLHQPHASVLLWASSL